MKHYAIRVAHPVYPGSVAQICEAETPLKFTVEVFECDPEGENEQRLALAALVLDNDGRLWIEQMQESAELAHV